MTSRIVDNWINNESKPLATKPLKEREAEEALLQPLSVASKEKIVEAQMENGLLPPSMRPKPFSTEINVRSIFLVCEVITADYVRKQKSYFSSINAESSELFVPPAEFKAFLFYLFIQAARIIGVYDFTDFEFPLMQPDAEQPVPLVLAILFQILRPHHGKGKINPVFEKLGNYNISGGAIRGENYVQTEISTPACVLYQGTDPEGNGIYPETYQENDPTDTTQYGDFVVELEALFPSVSFIDFIKGLYQKNGTNSIRLNTFNTIIAQLPHVAFSDLKMGEKSKKNYCLGARIGSQGQIVGPMPCENQRNLFLLCLRYNNSNNNNPGTNTPVRFQGFVSQSIYGDQQALPFDFAILETYQMIVDKAEKIKELIQSGVEIEDHHFLTVEKPTGGKKKIYPAGVHVPWNKSMTGQISNIFANAMSTQLKRTELTDVPEKKIDEARYSKLLDTVMDSFICDNIKRNTPSGLLSPNFGSLGLAKLQLQVPTIVKLTQDIFNVSADANEDRKDVSIIWPFFVKEMAARWGENITQREIGNEPFRPFSSQLILNFTGPEQEDITHIDQLMSAEQKKANRKLDPVSPKDQQCLFYRDKNFMMASLAADPEKPLFGFLKNKHPSQFECCSIQCSPKKQTTKQKKITQRKLDIVNLGMQRRAVDQYKALELIKAIKKNEKKKRKNMMVDDEEVLDCKTMKQLEEEAGLGVPLPNGDSFQRASTLNDGQAIVELNSVWYASYLAWLADPTRTANIVPRNLINMVYYAIQIEAALSMASLSDTVDMKRRCGGPQMRVVYSSKDLYVRFLAVRESQGYGGFMLGLNPISFSSPRNIVGMSFNLVENLPHQVSYIASDADVDDFTQNFPYYNRIGTAGANPRKLDSVLSNSVQQNGTLIRSVEHLRSLHQEGHYNTGMGPHMYSQDECKVGALLEAFAVGVVETGSKVFDILGGDGDIVTKGAKATKEVVGLISDGCDLVIGLSDPLDQQKSKKKDKSVKEVVKVEMMKHERKISDSRKKSVRKQVQASGMRLAVQQANTARKRNQRTRVSKAAPKKATSRRRTQKN